MLDNMEFVDMDEKYFDLFFEILKDSFPENERRDYLSQKKLLNNKYYKPLVLNKNDEILDNLTSSTLLNPIIIFKDLSTLDKAINI